MTSVRGTGRIARWRGQILNVLSRLWIQLQERGEDLNAQNGRCEISHRQHQADVLEDIRNLIKRIFAEMASRIPDVEHVSITNFNDHRS